MGDVAPGKRLRASARSWIAAHRSAGGDCSRGRLALVKPGLPATAFGGEGLTRASAPAPAPPCVRRRRGAGSPISTHSFLKRGVIFPPLPLTRCVRLTPTHNRGAVISHKLFPCLPLAPPQLDRIEEINVDAYRRLGKFGLRAEFEPAGEGEPRGRLAAHAFGKGTLALRITAWVEAPHRARRR